jgi:membrane protein DedA with SNARE-associated domain
VVSFTAGVAGMNPRTVAPLAVLSCAIWNALLMALGLWVGENWGTVVRNLQRIVFVAVLAAAAVLWFRAWRNRKRLNAVQKRTSAEE